MKKKDRHERPAEASEKDEFERAMTDVVRLPSDPRAGDRRVRVARTDAHGSTGKAETLRYQHPTARERADAEPDDFVAPGVNRREIRKLKRGEYAVEGRLDLHGMTAPDAEQRVNRFLENSRYQRQRCVCIVHGRGLRSAAGTPVLKTRVREWLRGHPSVLACVTAPPADGGDGAVYVLLRK